MMRVCLGLLLAASVAQAGLFFCLNGEYAVFTGPRQAWAAPAPDLTANDSGSRQLSSLDDQGRLTVRALMAWGALPDRYKPLIFEMRKKGVDLLGADAATILSWMRDSPAQLELTPDERILLRELASFMVGRNYLEQFRSEQSKQIRKDEPGKAAQSAEPSALQQPAVQEGGGITLAGKVFDMVANSTVVVTAHDASKKPTGQGSGVIYDRQLVATNCHTIEEAKAIMVHHEEQVYPAKIQHSDWDRDVCSLTVPGLGGPPVRIGKTETLRVGSRVYAVGAPMGLELTLSEGIVSSLRMIEDCRYIQTTAPISPGSSGGGLYDEHGRLVGLTTFLVRDSQNLNFALPVEWIHDLPIRHAAHPGKALEGGEWIEQAIALENEEDWPGLIDLALRWVRSEPDNALSWFCLGIGLKGIKQWERAIEAFKRSVRIEPDNASTWFSLGMAYRDAGQAARSVDALEQAIRIDPDEEIAWYYLGLSHLDLRNPQKALKAFGEALRLDPECPHNWYFLGVALYMQDEMSKVAEVYRKIRTLDTDIADVFFQKYVLP